MIYTIPCPKIVENGTIESFSLGYEDHGILTMYLQLKFGGGGCCFGGYALDSYDQETKRRVGSAFGTEFIAQCLKTVGVDDINKLVGKNVRVEHQGLGSRILSIGHITEDKWFSPKELVESMVKENKGD